MSNFTLKQDGFASYTTVSNCFIEQFMPYAAGEFVKIYIYLLKCVNENKSELSISRIADAFNNTEKDVVRALKYWQRKGLLRLTFDEENTLTSLNIVSLTDLTESGEAPVKEKLTLNVTGAPVPGQPRDTVKEGPELPKKREYSQTEILAFSDQEEISQLFYIIQKYLGRPLSGQDTNTVLYLLDGLKFPADLIEYLFEYCVSRNHRSIRYIEKTALNWAENGVRTVHAAKLMSSMYTDGCYQVLAAFGLNNRQPTRNEAEFVSRWTLSYGFPLQIVLLACSKTMDQLHQPSFEYTDAILKNWKSRGVTTAEDVRKLDEVFEQSSRRKEHKEIPEKQTAVNTRFNNFAQRSYDYSALEQKLIGNQ
ncbi:MAG: DnaD domain protein [Parasporobacterium sp.]|nr:DnaD domain protein [Parasporobacterium sp.]